MNRKSLEDWIAAYARLWRTPGTDGLVEIFAEDATYATAPYSEPYRGLDEVAGFWENEREGPDEEFEIRTEVVAVEGDTGVVRVQVDYAPPRNQQYKDIWIVRAAADGRCVSFEEWPFWPPGSEGSYASP